MALGGRTLIFASLPLAAAVAAVLRRDRRRRGHRSASSKILENMEIGHNVIHGQWDWMNDPDDPLVDVGVGQRLPGRSVEALAQRRAPHVDERDGQATATSATRSCASPRSSRGSRCISRSRSTTRCSRCMFQWGVAMHDIDLGALRRGETDARRRRGQLAGIGKKAGKQVLKDYVLWPLLAGPWFLPVAASRTWSRTCMRNVWSYAIIFCGHFPDGAQMFTEADVEGETARRLVPAPGARLVQHHGRPAVPRDERQPQPPDRAPPVPRHAEQSLPGGRAARRGDVREVRRAVQQGLVRAPARHDAAHDLPARAADPSAPRGERDAARWRWPTTRPTTTATRAARSTSSRPRRACRVARSGSTSRAARSRRRRSAVASRTTASTTSSA